MSVNDAVLSNLPKPQVERHDRVVQISLQPSVRLDQHILHDITDINSTLDFLIEPHTNQLPQRVAMLIHQLVHCGLVAFLCLNEQRFRLVGCWPHGRIIAETLLCCYQLPITIPDE